MWCETSGQLQKTECKLLSYDKLWLDVFAAMHFGSRSWLLSFSVYVLLKNQSFIFCLFVCFLGWTLFIIYLNQMTSHYVTLLTCSNTRLTDDVTSDHVTQQEGWGGQRQPSVPCLTPPPPAYWILHFPQSPAGGFLVWVWWRSLLYRTRTDWSGSPEEAGPEAAGFCPTQKRRVQ